MPVKPKKIPMRMCVACREMKPKRDLMRLVRPPEDEEQGGKLLFDKRGKMPGRGAYLCRDYACLEKAIKAKALERTLQYGIDDELLRQLRRELEFGGKV